jgi:hypothetical protein
MHALPIEAQMAPMYGIQISDVNHDRYPDLLLIGNDFGMETGQGRADAFNGLVLTNKGDGKFKAIPFGESGFFVPGDARAIAQAVVGGRNCFVATQNRKGLSIFSVAAEKQQQLVLQPGEALAMIEYADGRKQRIEFAYGSSFLAQNSRITSLPLSFLKITLMNQSGKQTRVLSGGN